MMTGVARRSLVPEQLDALAPDDPAALASRRDLRRINRLMAQAPIASKLVTHHCSAPLCRITDLGCGDGVAALRTLRRLGPAPSGARVTLLDASPAVTPDTECEFVGLGWKVEIARADVFDWLSASDTPEDLIITNLFLHHFEGAPLVQLMHGVAARSRLFVATEPLRTGASHMASRLVGLIGANAVTRHDAPASVRAGFRDRELSTLWPGEVLFEGRRGPFTQAFVGRD